MIYHFNTTLKYLYVLDERIVFGKQLVTVYCLAVL